MNIFGIGELELLLIFMLMLVVAGPKRMIHWSFIAGQYVGKLRNMWRDVAVMLQSEFDQAGVAVKVPQRLPTGAALRQELNKQARVAAQPVIDPLNATRRELQTTLAPTAKSTEGE